MDVCALNRGAPLNGVLTHKLLHIEGNLSVRDVKYTVQMHAVLHDY